MFFGSKLSTDVRFVPLKSNNMLGLFLENSAAPLEGVKGKEKVTEENLDIVTRDHVLIVPRDGLVRINFRNLTGVGGTNGQTLVLWTIRQPIGFKVNDFQIGSGSNQVIVQNAAKMAKISADPDNLPPDGEATWELLTTDGSNQLLRIKLRLAE